MGRFCDRGPLGIESLPRGNALSKSLDRLMGFDRKRIVPKVVAGGESSLSRIETRFRLR